MEAGKFRIGPLTAESVSAAAEVEKTCLETAWSESQIGSLPPGSVYLIASDGRGTVFGVCSARYLEEEAELLNLAVLPEYRRGGAAEALLDRLFDLLTASGCRKLFLEVAAGNEPAVSLYRKKGFSETGVRRGFYRGTDALTMEKPLC